MYMNESEGAINHWKTFSSTVRSLTPSAASSNYSESPENVMRPPPLSPSQFPREKSRALNFAAAFGWPPLPKWRCSTLRGTRPESTTPDDARSHWRREAHWVEREPEESQGEYECMYSCDGRGRRRGSGAFSGARTWNQASCYLNRPQKCERRSTKGPHPLNKLARPRARVRTCPPPPHFRRRALPRVLPLALF